ncbi:MAG TPA: glycosyltransferase, partial [Patescibacteria group bacterium]|nr:glycosyltransferase [Patescibacteria group bacterium]
YQAPQDLPEANQPRVYQAVTAACLIVRRALFNGLGGFDEQFWNGYEDIDLCFRIGQAGKLVVYQPESVVKHHESKGGPERFRKARQNIARLHQKWLGRIHPDFIAGEDGELTRTDTIAIRPYAGPTVQGANASSCIVSIIIPVLNQLADTRQCLESIVAHTRLPHEVIIVDNGSSDSTRSFLRTWQQSHSNCKVIRNSRNLGFAAANNQGFSIAAGEHLVLLNNDTVVTEGWIEGLLRVLRDHPQTGIVGPMSNNVSGPQYAGKVNYQELAELPGFAAEWSQTYKGQSMETPRAVGFCLLARRAVLDQIGGLDESFGSGNFEDDDFCIRARIAGFRIRIAKDVFIHHAGSQTFKTARIDYRQAMLRNWDIFRNKWKLPASTTLESGYPVPNQLPMGTHLRYEIRRLGATHEPDAHGCWEEKTSFGNAAALNRTLPAAATIGDLTSARDLFERKDLKAAWMQAIAAVQQRPFHPEAYLLLAEIALVSGDGQTARLCAQMARELTPDFRAPKQFLQKPLKGKNRPEWLEIPGWLQERISAKSQPSPCISVCIITRNEEAFIAQCLKSVKQIAHQIVVVDTGSTDRTIEIAKDFGAELYQFEWCDDFSAARNVALEHARGDWVLVLDADEELPVDQHARLHADLKNRNAIALRLPLINLGQEAEGCSCVPRLFRNAPGVYYHGRIHEQVFPSLIEAGNEWGLGTGIGTAQLLHHGYSKKQVRDRNKVERNLALLRLAVAESNDDPNLVMNFGLELIRSGDFSGGLTQYRRAFELMSERTGQETAPELREALLTQFTSHLYQAQAFDEVVEVLTSPLGRRAGLTASLHFALGLACFALNRFEEAAEQMRQCLAKRQQRELTPINTDILTAAPQHCLAMSLAKAGDLIGAEKAFQAGLTEKGREDELKLDYARFLKDNGRPVDALHQLHEVVSAKADCASAWRLGAEISLSQTEFLEFACDWTAEAVRHIPDNHELAAQRAEALLLSRQIAPALTAWEALWNREHQPRFQAAIILCQVLGEATPTSPEVCEAELGAVSRAFLAWYQRCLAMRAQPIVERVNERLETLSTMLPAASNMIEAALTEAAADSKATAEPCLA